MSGVTRTYGGESRQATYTDSTLELVGWSNDVGRLMVRFNWLVFTYSKFDTAWGIIVVSRVMDKDQSTVGDGLD